MSELLQKEQAEREYRASEPWVRWHWQNLNDKKDGSQGSGLRHGRCWWNFRAKDKWPGNDICFSWNLWTHFCGVSMDIDNEDLTFMIAFPPFALWLSFTNRFWIIAKLAPREPLQYYPDTIVIPDRQASIRIHSGSVWLKFWGSRDDWKRDDPWWKRGVNFSINPFEWKFMRHEVRQGGATEWGTWTKWAPAADNWYLSSDGPPPDGRELFEIPYRYVLKSGEIQERTARVCVERRAWRPRCLQWTSLFEKVRTSLDIKFSDEVGERTGSWKGGCTGCGWDLLPGETPEQALHRMEAVRKF